MRALLLLLCLALPVATCAPAETSMLPEALRAVATRAASSTTDRLLVVEGTFGDTTMSFATRQALITAGIVVEDAAADTTMSLLRFVSAAETDEGWRVRTRSVDAPGAAGTGETRVEWFVACPAQQCEVRDSAGW